MSAATDTTTLNPADLFTVLCALDSHREIMMERGTDALANGDMATARRYAERCKEANDLEGRLTSGLHVRVLHGLQDRVNRAMEGK